MPLRRRRLGRWLGWLAVGLSFAFVGARLWPGEAWQLARRAAGAAAARPRSAGALIYGLGGFLLSTAWRQLLALERPPGPAAGYHAVYGRSQIAKYLPGNCFHFVGRQVLGRALGHSQSALALASLLETALLVALAAGLAAPARAPLARRLGLAAAGRGGGRRRPARGPARGWRPRRLAVPAGRGGPAATRRLATALACHGAFFALAAASSGCWPPC